MEERVYLYQSLLTKTSAEVLAQFGVDPQGLSNAEAQTRLLKFGPNQIARKRTHGLRVLLRQFSSPFVYLLGFAALVAFLLNEAIDAITILVILLINGLLGFVQEYRAEQALKALEQLLVPRVRVYRQGKIIGVSAHELVSGDVVPIQPGDIAPADLRLIEVHGLVVDESILTGESVSVGKIVEPLEKNTVELSEAKNILFSGTRIVSGRAVGIVIATGDATVLGGIAHHIHQIERKSGYEAHYIVFLRS